MAAVIPITLWRITIFVDVVAPANRDILFGPLSLSTDYFSLEPSNCSKASTRKKVNISVELIHGHCYHRKTQLGMGSAPIFSPIHNGVFRCCTAP